MPAPMTDEPPQSQPLLTVFASDVQIATQRTAPERDVAALRAQERDIADLRDELGKFKQVVQEEQLANNKQMNELIQLQHFMLVSIKAAFADLGQNQGEPERELTEPEDLPGCCISPPDDKHEQTLSTHSEHNKFEGVRDEIQRILKKFNQRRVQQAPDEEKLREEIKAQPQKIGRTEEEEEEEEKVREERGKTTQEHKQKQDYQSSAFLVECGSKENKAAASSTSTKDEDFDFIGVAGPSQRTTVEIVRDLNEDWNHTYTLNESMWDVVLFMAMPEIGLFDSILVGFVMCINIIVTSMFCAICWIAFTESDFSEDIFSLKIWRWFFAHYAGHVTELWPMSLASRVCEDDASLILSGQQSELSNLIKEYRPDVFQNLGRLMCLLCLLIFWTKLWSEAKASIRFMTAAITISGKSSSIHTTLDGSGIKLTSISYLRAASVAIIFALRITILINLAAVVTIWLSNTTSLGDLLLNALALELVLDVDELLFQGLAPDKATVLVRNLLPLPLWTKKVNGVDVTAVLGICTMLVAIPSVYYSLLDHTLGSVNQASAALCEGATNFVYNVDQLGIVYIHDRMMTPSAHAFSEEGFDQSDTRIQAINDVIKGIPREEWQYAIHEPDLTSLKTIFVSEISARKDALNSQCTDLLANGVTANVSLPILAALRGATGNVSFDICSKENIEPYCYQSNLKPDKVTHLALLLCPVSCGCTSVNSGTLVLSSCPSACVNEFQTNLRASNPCQDADLKNSNSWKKWMQEAEFFAPSDLIESLQLEGCQALKKHPDRNSICEGSAEEWSGLKPLSGVCPASCGCRTELEGAPKNCPDSCSSALCAKSFCDYEAPGMYLVDGNMCKCEKDSGSCYEEECHAKENEETCKSVAGCGFFKIGSSLGVSKMCGCACSPTTFAKSACFCGSSYCANLPPTCYNEWGEAPENGTSCFPPCTGTPAKPLEQACLCGGKKKACEKDRGCRDGECL